MIPQFTDTGLPARVVFGFGTLERVGEEVRGLGCSRALVISGPNQRTAACRLSAILGALCAGMCAEAAMHTPVEVTQRALALAHSTDADCTVAIGGGSAIGLGKAIALRTDFPQVAIPTTYAGSEATPILGETDGARKTTQRTLKVLPEVIIYDVDLTLSLPPSLSATSGVNAIAHAVEALYANEVSPRICLLAEHAIGLLCRALPEMVQNSTNKDARSNALFAAWLCGGCLGSVGMALHHKVCHLLGGSFKLPHAATHAVILPHVVAYNASAAPAAVGCVARALDVENAAEGLFELNRRIGAPTALREIGMPEGELDKAADLAVQDSYWNPRPIERESIRTLLGDAYRGQRPRLWK